MIKQGNNHYTALPIEAKLKIGAVPNQSGCLVWQAGQTSDGYGVVTYKGKTRLAHRVSYEVSTGIAVEGKYVCHKCDNPLCINPEHLFLGTHKDNMFDMKTKGRRKGIGCGESNGRAKLTAQQAKEIREQRSNGVMLKTLASQYGVGTSTIARVASMENWK